jgi:hypothetical protein
VPRKIFVLKGKEAAGGYAKFQDEERHYFCSSAISIRIIKSRNLRRVMYVVARMGMRRNTYRVLVGKSEGKKRLGMLTCKCENIKMEFK